MRFTYHRSSEFRSGLWMIGALMVLEAPLVLGILYLLPRHWGWIVGLMVALLEIYVLATRIFAARFTWHQLTAAALDLRFGFWTCIIPRQQIAAVRPSDLRVDLGLLGQLVSYEAAADALVVSTYARGLVEVELREPLVVPIPRKGRVTVTRVLLGLDEPQLLLAACAGGAPNVMTEPVPALPAPAPSGSAASGEPSDASGGLIATNLSKRFGNFPAVQGVSLSVRPGEIVALLGGNGAGKSTTLQMMAGLLQPDSGQVIVAGHDLAHNPLAARAAFAYVPDTALLHESLTAREFLWFLGDLYGLDPVTTRSRTEELLGTLGLTARADTWVRGYSLGMRRKVSLAAGLLHRPAVLILDEVTNGLDPRANRDVLDLLVGCAREGAAVLLATHILPVAEEIAHRIAVLHAGQVRAVGTLPDLRVIAGLPTDASLEAVFLTLTQGSDHRCA